MLAILLYKVAFFGDRWYNTIKFGNIMIPKKYTQKEEQQVKSKFMAKLKLRLLLIAIAAIVVTVFSQGTLAYYTTVGKATNVVTSGNIKFVIHEKTAQGTDFPKEGVYIVPGDIVSKRVTVESLCDHPFYLRVKPVYGINGSNELTAEECFGLDIDRQNWIEKDGWFYYKDIVRPGETTPAVFSEVEIIGEKVDNSYIGKTLTLTVSAQAVQSENNPADTPLEALGWPEG